MDKYIDSSFAAAPLGLPTGQKCLKVSSGPYEGRTVLLYAVSSSTIKLVWADPPFTESSVPLDVITDSADFPFDAYMDQTGDIFLAYTVSPGNTLNFVKLTFNGGLWPAGSAVTVYDAEESFYPAIRRLTTGQLWITYTRISGGSYYISAKTSVDGGATWGQSSDPGDTLTAGSDGAYSRIVELDNFQFLFYSDGGDLIACRAIAIGSSVWGAEMVLASAGGYSEHFSVNASNDGRIGISYSSSSGLKFREFTGSYWTGEATIDIGDIQNPVVQYMGGEPVVMYIKECGDNMVQARYTKRLNNEFSVTQALDRRKAELKGLLLYNALEGTYQDRTSESMSTDPADIVHTASGFMAGDAGDALFLGMDEPYNYLRMILSSSGSGGVISWKYWDGQIWKAFVPQSGEWSLSDSEKDLLFWNDFQSIPGDWQKKTISGITCFWVSATVVTAFSSSPAGSRITGISNLNLISAQV